MILQLDCCAAAISLLIILANLEERRRNQHPGTASSAPGLKHFGALWSLVGALCKRLSFAERVSFDSRKPVHRVAALLMILHVTLIFGRLALNEEFGGLDPYTSDELSALLQLAISASLSILVALLGVGWGTRRKLTAVMRRLDLRIPDRRDWLAGLLTAIGLFAMAQAATVLWAQSVSADVFEAQTSSSRLIFNSFNGSLVAGLLLALLTGVSEELLFRGALQPVFGIVITSMYFVVIHVQYAFTPAALILFVVSLGFGWLRLRRGTNAAIIAHAVYNFLPFFLFHLAAV